MSIWYYILRPFSALLMWFYQAFGSYALSLVLFTIVIRIILFPLSLKGKKSMMQMNALSNRAQQLQKQYGKDKERYNQELTKLYEKAGVNPMSGCLWSLIPMPILIGLYSIVRRPMYYMMGITDDGIKAVATALNWTDYAHGGYNEIALTNMLNTGNNFETARSALGELGTRLTTIDFSFLGLDLSQTPNWKVWQGPFDWPTLGLVLIPVVVAILAVLSSRVSMKTNNMNRNAESSGNAAVDKTNRQMMYMMPIMYVWFGFIMPAGMSIYMSATSLVMMLQDVLCAGMLRKQFEELAAKQAAQELEEKEEEKRLKAERAAERARQAEEAKKARGKKKAAPAEPKKKDLSNGASRVGIRTYARGRAYDPDRYGGVTPYRDPSGAIDEAAVEEAREAKGLTAAEAAAEEETAEEETPLLREAGEKMPAEGSEETPEEEEEEEDAEGGTEKETSQEDDENE